MNIQNQKKINILKNKKRFNSKIENFIVFKIIYSLLFFTLLFFLFNLQFFEAEDFKNKERVQGQRRILKPGMRGNITDRNGKLLIGNKPEFSAVIHLDQLKSEIFKEKIKLKKFAFELRKSISEQDDRSLSYLLQKCLEYPFINDRKIKLLGSFDPIQNDIPKVILGNHRIPVNYERNGNWISLIYQKNQTIKPTIKIFNVRSEINVDVAGLFSTLFFNHRDNNFYSYKVNKLEEYNFKTNAFSLGWEARYSVVNKYLKRVSTLLGKNFQLSMSKLKNHWNKRLVLPMELVGGLKANEYALLIEGIEINSPIQVQSSSIRHYPGKDLASHVLGYVGSGYEADTVGLTGNDLATFEIKGKKGKSGIEKHFDDHLRGKDGSEIWRINPIGLRYDLVHKQMSGKGRAIQLSIDRDIQKVAEDSLKNMSKKVSSHRSLPDTTWKKTLERRTKKELIKVNENQISPEILLSAFKFAPFPIGAKEATTVAGFQGTEEDAEKLLRLLYSKGVLEKDQADENGYIISPPPPPPGAAVILNVKTGEILALASIPNYDLEHLSPRISQRTYDKIERQEAWLPRAWHPGYSPASPFKLVTAVAGLRSKVVDPDEELICEGIYKGMICHCYPGKHGAMDLRNAESQSCNVYFFQLAERLGERALIAEAKSFGMDHTPDIELPRLRNSPNVPDPNWKQQQVGENWALEDTFNVAIGQGGLRQSPLQMACFAAALSRNEKRFHPTLLKSHKTLQKSAPIGISDYEYKAIIDGMVLATTKGTAKRCRIEGIDVAGKTGTAQWRNHNMKLSLAWFIGFAPVEKPEVAIAVLIEGVIPQDHIQGGLTAAPVAKDILQAYFNKQKVNLTNSLN